MAYSKWIDKTGRSLDNIISNFMVYRESKNDPLTKEKLLNKVSKIFDKNMFVEIDGEKINYNSFVYEYEFIRKNEITNPTREKRIGTVISNIIVLNFENKNYFIVDKGYTTSTLADLRSLCGYSGKMEIVGEPFGGIKTEIFIWMIHYLIDLPMSYFDTSKKMKIKSVVGYKGATADKMAEISGTGEKVMKMLTTLLFLFENQNISKIEAKIYKDKECFCLTLGERSFVEIDFNGYEGTDMLMTKEEIKSRVVIKVFVDIIPNLIRAYSHELETERWTVDKENDFFSGIGTELSKRINEKLENKGSVLEVSDRSII